MAGNGTNCVRIVPYSAVQFGSYNFYKRVSTMHAPLTSLCWVPSVAHMSRWEEPKLIRNDSQNFFESTPGADLSPLARLTCGGIAGITSVFCTYPLDIVRTRLSIQTASFAELGPRAEKLPGMWTVMGTMYKTEGGISALYRGIIPTVAGVAPYVRGPDVLKLNWS